MNWPNFSTTIDLYLAGAIYTVSVFVTVIWLRRTLTRNEQRIKATEGQIAARILLIVLSLLILCYLIDLAFWSVVGLILAILILGLGIGGEPGGVIAMPFVLGALFIREFVLGFPGLVLEPEPMRATAKQETDIDPLIGQQVVTISPLRPTGSIVYEGRILPAASEAGRFVDSDTAVSVTGFRNGIYLVETISEELIDRQRRGE